MRNNQKGFTLVELAIVMIIIGLLIGGVLKGQELIENAKISATISEIKAYQAAMITFRDAYGGIPGDILNARARITNCTAATNCANGDGNSMVGLGSWYAANNGSLPNWQTNLMGAPETVQFWKHLALADLITGINIASPTTTTSQAWGQTHPASSLRGGYELYYDNITTYDVSGPFLRLSNTGVSSSPNIGADGTSPASPREAAMIDRKMDDGIANSGFVRSNYGTSGSGACYNNDGVYSENLGRKSCVMSFLIDG
jgi:prepilin-type N-terminal cleavage/methylation domain-containing protein